MSDDQYRLPILKPEGNVPESQRIAGEEHNVPVLATRLDEAIGFFERNISDALGWARKNSIFQYPFVTACCGMEYMSAMAGRYDIARFGAEFPRFSPRQADLLMIVGTINVKQSPGAQARLRSDDRAQVGDGLRRLRQLGRLLRQLRHRSRAPTG